MYEKGDIEITQPTLEPEKCKCYHGKEHHSINTGWCAACEDRLSKLLYKQPWDKQCQEYQPRAAYWRSGIQSGVPDASKPTAYLPHSCDEWVIGGRAEVEAMIEDLQEILTKLDGIEETAKA